MAAFPWGRKIRLVRNHEVRGPGTAFGPADLAYDAGAGGGNTVIEFDPRNPGAPKSWGVLSGTSTNCAGGLTPWLSWLTCEETTETLGKPHGYVFEAPAWANGFRPATPIPSMGRFAHEALVVEPWTNITYLTEDAGGTSGFYRHVPHSWLRPLAGGKLQMLKVVGQDNVNLGASYPVGTTFDVEWVDIAAPDPAPGGATPFQQGAALGGAAFRRLEGAWYSKDDRAIYFNSTDGGAASAGQVWAWRRERRREVIELVVRVAVDRRPAQARQHHGEPERRRAALRGPRPGPPVLPAGTDRGRRAVRLRRQHPARDDPRVDDPPVVGRVRRGDVQRRLDVRQHPDARRHLRHHRPLERRPAGLTALARA